MKIASVTETISEYVRAEILIGALRPGQKLNENELSSRLDVSRAPLREAFRILEGEGLVNCKTRKGTYVNELTVSDLEKVYQARDMVEGYAIKLLQAKNITELPEVRLALKKELELPIPSLDDAPGILAYHAALVAFHTNLVRAAGNRFLDNLYNIISSSLTRYQCIYLNLSGLMENSPREHKLILEKIKLNDFETAEIVLREHIDNSFKYLRDNIFASLPNDESLR